MVLTRTRPYYSSFDRLVESVFHPLTERGLPMDATWQGDELVLTLDVPGVAEEAIDVTVKDRLLTITAEREETTTTEDDRVVLRERSFGRWARTVRLGSNLDADNVQATYRSGVLTVVIPSLPQAAERKIEIHRASDGEQAPGIETTSSEPTELT